jgi:hypothetical protein
LKYLAQRALISYLQFVFKAKNKVVFNAKNIDAAGLAHSFGLSNAPILTFKKNDEDADINN